MNKERCEPRSGEQRIYEKTSDKRLEEFRYQLKELKRMRKESLRVKKLEEEILKEIERRDRGI
ncbi:MAG: hypothetical protein ABIL14_01405 [candidate division WOR-3 bacterium]